jgi:HAD superfamily hydrolase (TIGR01549 family)
VVISKFSATHILFDWDGTLLDSYAADVRAYLTMFRAFGIEWTEAEIARHYSPNWYRVYKAARLDPAQWDRADKLWSSAYAAEAPPLLPGARRVIRWLEGKFTLGIVTSGNRARVRGQLRAFDLAQYFSVCVYSEDAKNKKPHPEPLQLALKRLHAKPRNCLYIGDTAEDMEMARRAGVREIGVLGPFPTAQRIRAARPQLLLNSVQELPAHLERMDEKGSDGS